MDDAKLRGMKQLGCCSKRCINCFDIEEILKMNIDSRALDYNTDGTNYLDMVILGQLRSLCRSQNILETGIRSVEQKERKRLRVIYKLSAVDVCEALFLFANGIKIKRFKRILKHYKEEGLVLLTHKNQKVTPKHSIS